MASVGVTKSSEAKAIALRNMLVSLIVYVFIGLIFFITVGLTTAFLKGGINGVKLMVTDNQLNVILLNMRDTFIRDWEIVIKNYKLFSRYRRDFLNVILGTSIPLVVFGLLIYRFRHALMNIKPFDEPESQHGDAHWATEREVVEMGLRKKQGLLLGVYKGKYLCEYSFQHVLLFAPTGSGKGVGFVIPNLLFWTDSAIVHDVKGENYELTSGYRYRNMKQKVFVWNPADQQGRTHCYNPLDWVARDVGGLVDDIQKIAKFMYPKEDFWVNEARVIVTGVMLALYADDSKPRTLGEVLRTLKNDDVAYNLAVMLDVLGGKMHPVAYMNIGSYLQKPDKERGSVTSTATSALELFSNPFVDAATSKSHFNLGTFKRVPTTVYCCISPNNIERLKPVLSIFYNQCASIFTNKMPDKKLDKYGVLMLLDEFPTLGKLEDIKIGIAYYRGYMVKLFLIVQDTQQLKAIYEEAGMNSFLSNSTYRITYAANNNDTAKLISDLLGTKTITVESGSRAKYIDLNPTSRTVNVSKASRALLLPQEVITLPRDEEIILIESKAPIRCKKIIYYKDPFFTKRLLKPTVVPKQEPYIPKNVAKKNNSGEGENSAK